MDVSTFQSDKWLTEIRSKIPSPEIVLRAHSCFYWRLTRSWRQLQLVVSPASWFRWECTAFRVLGWGRVIQWQGLRFILLQNGFLFNQGSRSLERKAGLTTRRVRGAGWVTLFPLKSRHCRLRGAWHLCGVILEEADVMVFSGKSLTQSAVRKNSRVSTKT